MWVTITHTQQHTYSRSHYEKQWEKEIEEVSLTKLSNSVCVCVCDYYYYANNKGTYPKQSRATCTLTKVMPIQP